MRSFCEHCSHERPCVEAVGLLRPPDCFAALPASLFQSDHRTRIPDITPDGNQEPSFLRHFRLSFALPSLAAPFHMAFGVSTAGRTLLLMSGRSYLGEFIIRCILLMTRAMMIIASTSLHLQSAEACC